MKGEPPILGLVEKLSLLGFGVLAFFIFLPAFITKFGMQNDYGFLGYSPAQDWLGFPESLHLFAIGRPVGAVFLNLHGFFLRSLTCFGPARFFSFAVMLGSAWLIFQHLATRLRVDRVIAAAMGICVLLLPAGQLYILWLTNFVPGALNMLFALLFYRILDEVDPVEFLRGGGRSLRWAAIALSFFFLSLCIYPPTALTFLALTFAKILFLPAEDWSLIRRLVLRDLVFAGAGMILYLLAFKLVLLPLFAEYGSDAYRETVSTINQEGGYRFELTSNLMEKISEFGYLSTLGIGGTLHAIVGDGSVWVMLGLTFAAFIYAAFCGRAPGRDWAQIAQRTAFGFLIMLCAISPSLMAEKGQTGYRVVSTYEMISLFCLVAPLHWLGKMRADFHARGIAAMLVFVMGSLAAWNVAAMARAGSMELLFVRQKLVTIDKNQLATVVGIYRHPSAAYLEWPLQLEFNCEISHVSDFAGAIRDIMPEVGMGGRPLTYLYDHSRKRMNLPATEVSGAEIPPLVVVYPDEGALLLDEQSVLIDFNELSFPGPRVTVLIPTIHTSNGSGGRALVDPFISSYWQPGAAPQWVEFSLPQGVALKQMTLEAGPDPAAQDEMPRDWRVMASDDGINWKEIDAKSGQSKWNVGEKRAFAFAHPVTAKRYAIIFTAGNGPVLRLFKLGF